MGMYRNHLVENDNYCMGGYIKDSDVVILKYDGFWIPSKLVEDIRADNKEGNKNESKN